MLDTKGLNCPLPVLKTRRAMRDMNAGDTIEIVATDPLAARDFEAFCEATGHELVESRHADGVFTFLIRKSA